MNFAPNSPAFKLTVNGSDLTGLYHSRLIRIQVEDQSTEQADSCTVELSDKDGKLPIPTQGSFIEISLGFGSNLIKVGGYIVDTVEWSGPPDKMTLTGKSAPFTAVASFTPFQSRKTRSFDNITLGNLVRTIAAECGLTAAVDPSFDAIMVKHLDQHAESDMNLLTRLSRDYGAVMKPLFGMLGFSVRGAATSVNGQTMTGMNFIRKNCLSYSAHLGKRQKVNKVRCRYHDSDSGETHTVENFDEDDGSTSDTDTVDQPGDPSDSEDAGPDTSYEHPHSFDDQTSARAAAKSIKDALRRGSETVSVKIIGNPKLVSEGTMTLSGFKPYVDGEWIVKRVRHEFSSQGFVTEVEGENSAARELRNFQTAKAGKGRGSGGNSAFAASGAE